MALAVVKGQRLKNFSLNKFGKGKYAADETYINYHRFGPIVV